MSACPSLAGSGSAGMSAALRSIDCQAGEATAFAFGRLFGADGRLLPALTLLLTLYVAFFAVSLLTGRTRLGVSALTPRMMTLGLVLTFATSWAAYQNVVWTLATGAPDQIAGVITGSSGSATSAFADRLDRLFTVVSDAADQAARPAPPTETGITPATPMVGGFTAATVLSLSSAMLLLGTVGVLVTSKIALAAMLALGPLFIVLALFPGTRGLFEGWLKAVVLFALVPLLAVLIGGGAVVALEPVARSVSLDGVQSSTRAIGVLFLGASVYVALMVMAVKTATTLVGGWRIPGHVDRGEAAGGTQGSATSTSTTTTIAAEQLSTGGHHSDDRIRGMVTSLPSAGQGPALVHGGYSSPSRHSAQVIPFAGGQTPTPARDPRTQSIGTRFRPRPAALRKERIS